MKCQILFSRKNKKNVISLSSAEHAHSVISVNDTLRVKLLFAGDDLNKI